jgi:Domain of Unknown Function (DUF326)
MSYARQMLAAYPGVLSIDATVLAATIEALSDCAQACTADTRDDLSEPCIRLCLDCADICTATVGVASRQRELNPWVLPPLLDACAAICRSCADECERHGQLHLHCQVCATACRRGEQASRELLAAMS